MSLGEENLVDDVDTDLAAPKQDTWVKKHYMQKYSRDEVKV